LIWALALADKASPWWNSWRGPVAALAVGILIIIIIEALSKGGGK
jgi:hypothetical protein